MYQLTELKNFLPSNFYDELGNVDSPGIIYDSYKLVANEEIENLTGYNSADLVADAKLKTSLISPYSQIIIYLASNLFDGYDQEFYSLINSNYKLAINKLKAISKPITDSADGNAKIGLINNVPSF